MGGQNIPIVILISFSKSYFKSQDFFDFFYLMPVRKSHFVDVIPAEAGIQFRIHLIRTPLNTGFSNKHYLPD